MKIIKKLNNLVPALQLILEIQEKLDAYRL